MQKNFPPLALWALLASLSSAFGFEPAHVLRQGATIRGVAPTLPTGRRVLEQRMELIDQEECPAHVEGGTVLRVGAARCRYLRGVYHAMYLGPRPGRRSVELVFFALSRNGAGGDTWLEEPTMIVDEKDDKEPGE